MCQICNHIEYDKIINLRPCFNTDNILPTGLINLEDLDIHNSHITGLPSDMINLKKIYARNSKITMIPDTFTKLSELCIAGTQIETLPSTLKNLEYLIYSTTPLDNNYSKDELKKIFPKLVFIKNFSPFYDINKIKEELGRL